MLRPLLVFWLIAYSFRYCTRPWNFFQLNSDYFNGEKNIFSKHELDQYIPQRWRLKQVVDNSEIVPEFPVFVKPEWGQNSNGVSLARDLNELQTIRKRNSRKEVTFLLQEAAKERLEFEIFYIRSPENSANAAILSVTETINKSDQVLPVNGIRNKDSLYRDRTDQLSDKELETLWAMMKTIGLFRIARVGLRSESLEDMLKGKFHVIEVNIFLPMPLVLLDAQLSRKKRHQFIRKSMKVAAKLAQIRNPSDKRYPIFFRKLIAHYKVKE